MASVTGFTAERMLEIENAAIVSGAVDLSGHLILTNKVGDEIDAGNVVGPQGPSQYLNVSDTSTLDLSLSGTGSAGSPWSLSGNIILPDRLKPTGKQVTNWNDATEAGFYWGNGATNQPSFGVTALNWFVGIVQYLNHPTSTSRRILQTLKLPDRNDGPTFTRYYEFSPATWSAWKITGDGLPEYQTDLVAGVTTIASGNGVWTDTAASVSFTPDADLLVEVVAGGELASSSTTVYAMLGANVTGGVDLIPPSDQIVGGGAMYGVWAPFTYSSVYVNQNTAPKPVVIPKGVETTFSCAYLRNGITGTQLINYPTILVRPIRWA